jgi:hypothetical protein
MMRIHNLGFNTRSQVAFNGNISSEELQRRVEKQIDETLGYYRKYPDINPRVIEKERPKNLLGLIASHVRGLYQMIIARKRGDYASYNENTVKAKVLWDMAKELDSSLTPKKKSHLHLVR